MNTTKPPMSIQDIHNVYTFKPRVERKPAQKPTLAAAPGAVEYPVKPSKKARNEVRAATLAPGKDDQA